MIFGLPVSIIGLRAKKERLMINFEEELKKFQPSMDIEQTQDAVYSNKYEDVTDVVKDLLKELGSR